MTHPHLSIGRTARSECGNRWIGPVSAVNKTELLAKRETVKKVWRIIDKEASFVALSKYLIYY
jgi:hypothetical protein